MQAVKRPYVMAAAACAATSLVAVTPLASQVATDSAAEAVQAPIRAIETKMVDSSIFNIPFNLFQDIMNIPASELDAVNYASESLFNSGPWFVVSDTNLWGVDPGDPSHFMSVVNFLIPFEGLSGINAPETDFDGGLGQQLWGLVATALPISSACDATDCLPVSPTSPITGIGGVDWFLHLDDILDGKQPFPLFDEWFKVSLDQVLAGYTFNPAADGLTDPSGPAYTIFDNIPGTGDGNLLAWAGDTYTLQPWVPIENFINGLMADPNYSNFQIPDFEEIGRALQSITAASVMAFDPFTPGSPFCPGACTDVTNANADYVNLVQAIQNLWPGNETIQTWLDAYASGTANVPTEDQIQNSINILQQGFWDFGNPSPPDGPDYSATIAEWQTFWTSLGFDTTNPPVGEGIAGEFAALGNAFTPEQLTVDFTSLAAGFSPEQLAADWTGLLGSFDPATLSTEWATLLAQLAPDLAGSI
jgi:hypothetical protein